MAVKPIAQSGLSRDGGTARPSCSSRSGSSRASIAVIFPFVMAKTMTEYGSLCGAMTAPTVPLTSAGTM
jgi:hypothetical protein